MSSSLRGVHRIRVLLDILMFVSIIFAPWWVPTLIAFMLCLRFRAWEVVLAGMFMDLYWMPQYVSFTSFDSIPLGTVIAVLFLFGFEPLRRQLLIGPEIL